MPRKSKPKKQSKVKVKKSTVEALRGDFRNFLYVIWRYLGLPQPSKRQYEVADFLQDTSHKRRIIMAYRGFGKSWITSAYTLWKLFKNPNEKILVLSATGTRAKEFTTFVQRLILDIPLLNHLVPPPYARWSSISFDVAGSKASHAPSVKATGVFSQITGSRASEIILDDVETIDNVETELMRAKLLNVLGEMENIIVPEGVITFLGTPHSVDSIYGKSKLLSRGYEAHIWPARYPTIEDLTYYENRLAPKIRKELKANPGLVGEPTDPDRFNEEILKVKELGAGRSNFMMQFMLNPSLSDELKFPLKVKDLVVFETDVKKAPSMIRHTTEPEYRWDLPGVGVTGKDYFYKPSRVDKTWLEYQGIYMSIDPSGRGKDQTAYSIIGQLNGKLYLLDLGGFEGGYDEHTLTQLAVKAKEYNVNKIVIESNFGDGLFSELFKPILYKTHSAEIEEVRQRVQKEKRLISTLEPVMNQHRLVVDIDIIKKEYVLYQDEKKKTYSLIYQMTQLADEKDCLKHDDKIDALAICVQAWQESLGLDEEEMLRRYKEEQFDEMLENFLETATGIHGNSIERYSDERDWFKNI